MTHTCQHNHGKKLNKELGRDPTGTTTLRKKYVQDFGGRNRDIRGTIRAALTERDVMGIKSNVNQEALRRIDDFDFSRDANKLDSFGDWLDGLLDDEYLEKVRGVDRPTTSGRWTDTYIRSAHKKGLRDADRRMAAEGLDIPNTTEIKYEGVTRQAVHSEKLQLLYSRNWQAVNGVRGEAKKVVSRTLAEGMARGQGPYKIAEKISEELTKIHNVNETAVARTEIINAHAEATLDRYEQVGIDEVAGKAELSTAGDRRVCDICASLEGEIMPTQEARGVVPVHPLCRCSWLPVTSGDDLTVDPSMFPTTGGAL